jgi:serpin B
MVSDFTALILVNAVYFKAFWKHPFDIDSTRDDDFHLLDGEVIKVPMMHQAEHFPYYDGDWFQVIELPYSNNLDSMVIFLPDEGHFQELEDGFTSDLVNSAIDGLHSEEKELSMPKFEFASEFNLNKPLSDMGMPDIFSPGKADFTGVTGDAGQIWVDKILHKAFIHVDEKTTEAAAATAVIEVLADRVTPYFRIDHPFIFIIRDRPTGAILFTGRVVNPLE